jgi:uncharacterized protein with NRDE domain
MAAHRANCRHTDRCTGDLRRRDPTVTLVGVCLLVFAWQVESSHPLTVAANRDERLDRPGRPFTVLRDQHPRVLGGRDDLAGGTWLAVNEHGVVAGLTNRPSPEGRDASKRTRGELPLLLAGDRTAGAAVETLVRRVRPSEYNPAWLLVGDRRSLYYLELVPDRPVAVHRLDPGVHVLENVPLDQPSAKADRVRTLVSMSTRAGGSLWDVLPSILADHTVPDTGVEASGAQRRVGGSTAVGTIVRRPETLASCVHADGYGTRSATLVRVPDRTDSPPHLLVADGSPCQAPFVDVSGRWAR